MKMTNKKGHLLILQFLWGWKHLGENMKMSSQKGHLLILQFLWGWNWSSFIHSYTQEDKLINISHHPLDLSCELGPHGSQRRPVRMVSYTNWKREVGSYTFNFSHDFRFTRKSNLSIPKSRHNFSQSSWNDRTFRFEQSQETAVTHFIFNHDGV